MDRNEPYPDTAHEGSDSDEVEILEVVGVEERSDTEPDPVEPPEAEPPEEFDGEEYVLDFDEGEAIAEPLPLPDLPPESGEPDNDRIRLLRLRADYDNLRKRIERERADFEVYANYALVGRLLPVLDNLERALAVESTVPADGGLREGLVMIHRQLTDQLRKEGLEPIEAVGKRFDPNLHDAVVTERTSDHPAHTIVEELQKGYVFQKRVLRPSLVKVSTGNGVVEGDE